MKKYSKLETTGVWSSIDKATSKRVNISFGSISLNIADTNNEPISQWAYGSVRLVKKNIDSVVFSPDEEETEYLKIFDKDVVKYLLDLSEKKINRSNKRILNFILLIFIFSICAFFIYKYHRLILENLSLTITSQEQENFIGSLVIKNLKGLSVCNSDSRNNFLNTFITKKLKNNKTFIKVSFFSSYSKYSLLLPGGTLLIPKNIINSEQGLINFEKLVLNSLKLQAELRPIKLFFSTQKNINLVFYILGHFDSLDFNNHLKFRLENFNQKFEERFNIEEKDWMKIQNVCT